MGLIGTATSTPSSAATSQPDACGEPRARAPSSTVAADTRRHVEPDLGCSAAHNASRYRRASDVGRPRRRDRARATSPARRVHRGCARAPNLAVRQRCADFDRYRTRAQAPQRATASDRVRVHRGALPRAHLPGNDRRATDNRATSSSTSGATTRSPSHLAAQSTLHERTLSTSDASVNAPQRSQSPTPLLRFTAAAIALVRIGRRRARACMGAGSRLRNRRS